MTRKTWLKWGLSALILIGLVVTAVRYLNAEAVTQAFARFDYVYAPWIIGLGVAYPLVKGVRLAALLKPVSDVAPQTVVLAHLAGTAVALLPGGFAARAGLLSVAGVPLPSATPPVLLASLFDQALLLLGVMIATLWYEQARLPALLIGAGVLALAALLAVPVVRSKFAHLSQKFASHFKFLEEWRTSVDQSRALLNAPALVTATAFTLMSLAIKVLALHLCLLGVGWSLPLGPLVLAFILPTLLARLSPVPAGLGVAEASAVGFLVANSTLPAEEALAASALFRLATVLLPALLGALVYFTIWRARVKSSDGESHRQADQGDG